ncbi:MAG: hypothetical protein JAY90_21570 [Candidatus Thiodiazotropha lotti]|nr:hypothetical protein [Candidatus Thiodiazotropha lotti]
MTLKMPYLYNMNRFEVIESEKPEFWVTEYREDKEEYSYPSSWNVTGFFEGYHDGLGEIVIKFWNDYKVLYGIEKGV